MVGYQKATIGDVFGTIDIGVSFANLGEADGSFKFADKIFNNDTLDGDMMLIFNPAAYNYDFYTYMPNSDGTGMIWQRSDAVTGLTDDLLEVKVNNGDVVELLPIDASYAENLSVAGQVADLKGASRTFNVDFGSGDPADTMFPITNPFPVATTKKMLDSFAVDGDMMLIWNDAAYNYDFLTYMPNGDGTAMIWQVSDAVSGEPRDIVNDDDVVIPAGHGGILLPIADGIRTWTVSLQD